MIKDIPIKSPELLEILDRWVSVMDMEGWEENVHIWNPNEWNVEQKEKWTGDAYLKRLLEVEGNFRTSSHH